jgi:hypothetical protein
MAMYWWKWRYEPIKKQIVGEARYLYYFARRNFWPLYIHYTPTYEAALTCFLEFGPIFAGKFQFSGCVYRKAKPEHNGGKARQGSFVTQLEPDGRDHEQMHGCDFRGMVTQKGAPSLAGRSPSLDQVFGHRRLGDLKAELE